MKVTLRAETHCFERCEPQNINWEIDQICLVMEEMGAKIKDIRHQWIAETDLENKQCYVTIVYTGEYTGSKPSD